MTGRELEEHPSYQRMLEMMHKVADLEGALALLGWDQRVNMPPKAAVERARQRATLSRLIHEMVTSDEFYSLVKELAGQVDLDSLDDAASQIRVMLRELDKAGIITLADKGYQGAGASIVFTPYKGRDKPESQKQANRSHAKLRGPGERANAQLKSWRILRKLRCSPSKAGHLVKAIAVLQNCEVTRGRRRAIVTADQLGMIGVLAIA